MNFKLSNSIIINRALSIFWQFAFTLILVNSLTPSTFGDYRYILIWLSVFILFNLPGLDSYVTRKYWNKIKVDPLSILLCKILFSYLLVFLTILFFYDIVVRKSPYVILLLFLLPFIDTSLFIKNIYYSLGRASISEKFLLRYNASKIISGVISLAFLLYLHINIYLFIFLYFFGICIYPLYVLQKKYKFRLQSKSYYINIYSNGFILTLSSALSLFSLSFDKYFASHYFSSDLLAKYSILILLPFELARLIDSILPTLYKKFNFFFNFKFILALFLISAVFCLFFSYSFFYLSPIIFGDFYSYDLMSVILASILIPSLSFEYFTIHNIILRLRSIFLLFYHLLAGVLISLLFFIYNQTLTINLILFFVIVKSTVLPVFALFLFKHYLK